MQPTDDTQPRRADIFPQEDETDDTGPGCVIWGLVAIMGLILSVAIVLAAAEAGVHRGAVVGAKTAVAREQAFIARECEILPTNIARAQVEIVRDRYDNWAQQGSIPACAQGYIQQATQIYLDSLATATPEPSATLEPTATPTVTDIPLPTATSADAPLVTVDTAPTSIYDLAGLLQEARDAMSAEDYRDAIRTLDAIIAIDPTYETATVNQLLFTSLTNRATRLYRTGGSLAEAIQLTNLAEKYGDIGDLAFERSIAQYYVDAQGFLDVNFGAAIQQLNLVRTLAPNYRNTNQLLLEQYTGYADSLITAGDPCRAVQQYDTALAFQPQAAIQTKRTEAQALCSGIGITPVGATLDPNSTPDPNQPTIPVATATNAIAPVGQPGG